MNSTVRALTIADEAIAQLAEVYTVRTDAILKALAGELLKLSLKGLLSINSGKAEQWSRFGCYTLNH